MSHACHHSSGDPAFCHPSSCSVMVTPSAAVASTSFHMLACASHLPEGEMWMWTMGSKRRKPRVWALAWPEHRHTTA